MAGSVLIVDDSPGFRRLARHLLAACGFEVVGEAGDAAEALRIARLTRPEGVLVDLGLPDRGGRELAVELVALDWQPRVLLTSADPDADADADEWAAGLPFVPKDLLPSAPLLALLGSASAR